MGSEFLPDGRTDRHDEATAVLCSLLFDKRKDFKGMILYVLYVFGILFVGDRPKYVEKRQHQINKG